jgi:hypothetical protein
MSSIKNNFSSNSANFLDGQNVGNPSSCFDPLPTPEIHNFCKGIFDSFPSEQQTYKNALAVKQLGDSLIKNISTEERESLAKEIQSIPEDRRARTIHQIAMNPTIFAGVSNPAQRGFLIDSAQYFSDQESGTDLFGKIKNVFSSKHYSDEVLVTLKQFSFGELELALDILQGLLQKVPFDAKTSQRFSLLRPAFTLYRENPALQPLMRRLIPCLGFSSSGEDLLKFITFLHSKDPEKQRLLTSTLSRLIISEGIYRNDLLAVAERVDSLAKETLDQLLALYQHKHLNSRSKQHRPNIRLSVLLPELQKNSSLLQNIPQCIFLLLGSARTADDLNSLLQTFQTIPQGEREEVARCALILLENTPFDPNLSVHAMNRLLSLIAATPKNIRMLITRNVYSILHTLPYKDLRTCPAEQLMTFHYYLEFFWRLFITTSSTPVDITDDNYRQATAKLQPLSILAEQLLRLDKPDVASRRALIAAFRPEPFKGLLTEHLQRLILLLPLPLLKEAIVHSKSQNALFTQPFLDYFLSRLPQEKLLQVHSYLSEQLKTITTPLDLSQLSLAILTNPERLRLHDDHPIFIDAMEKGSSSDPIHANNAKYPYHLYPKIELFRKQYDSSEAVKKFREELKEIPWNLSTLYNDTKSKIAATDLPKDINSDTLKTLLTEAEQRLASLSPEKQKTLYDFFRECLITNKANPDQFPPSALGIWQLLKNSQLTNPFVIALHTPSEGGSISEAKLMFFCILKSFCDAKNEPREGLLPGNTSGEDLLTERENLLLHFCLQTMTCSVGYDETLPLAYNTLDKTYKKESLMAVDTTTNKVHLFLRSCLDTCLDNTFAGEKLLAHFGDQKVMAQGTHNTAFLKNAFHFLVGRSHTPKMDGASVIVGDNLVKLLDTPHEFLRVFYQLFTPKLVAEEIMRKAEEYRIVPGSNQETIEKNRAFWNSLFPNVKDVSAYFELDDVTYQIKSLTEAGALALLQRFDYI